jgi:hypothetical protein
MDIWYSSWSFGTVRGHLAYFFPFWYFVPRKIWQPWHLGREEQNKKLKERSSSEQLNRNISESQFL